MLPELDRPKFLIKRNYDILKFKMSIKPKLKHSSKTETMFFFCGKTLLNDNLSIGECYDQFKDPEDGFLYITYYENHSLG